MYEVFKCSLFLFSGKHDGEPEPALPASERSAFQTAE